MVERAYCTECKQYLWIEIVRGYCERYIFVRCDCGRCGQIHSLSDKIVAKSEPHAPPVPEDNGGGDKGVSQSK